MKKFQECYATKFLSKTKTGEEVIVCCVSSTPRIKVSENSPENVLVEFKPEGSKYAVGGWLNVKSQLYSLIEKCANEGVTLLARIEYRWKKNADKSLGLVKAASDSSTSLKNVSKELVGVWSLAKNGWVLTERSISDLSYDESPEAENFRKSISWAISGASVEDISGDLDNIFASDSSTVAKPNTSASAPIIAKKSKDDKTQALLGLYLFVREQENKQGYQLEEGQRQFIAKQLLLLADKLQCAIYELEEADYRAYSHTRARHIIYSFAETIFPLNQQWTTSKEAFAKWVNYIEQEGTRIWKWAETA